MACQSIAGKRKDSVDRVVERVEKVEIHVERSHAADSPSAEIVFEGKTHKCESQQFGSQTDESARERVAVAEVAKYVRQETKNLIST